MNSEKFWNETFYKDMSKKTHDFLKDTWLEKYKEYILTNNKNKKAIDLGCGYGQDSNWLQDNNYSVIACDISTTALEKLKEMYPSIQTKHLNLEEPLPFKSNTLDLVNANLSIQYFKIEKTKEIFEEIRRILKPGGIFIGRINSTKNNYIKLYNLKEVEKNLYYDKEYNKYTRLYTLEDIKELTKKFKILHLEETSTIRLNKTKYIWEFILKK